MKPAKNFHFRADPLIRAESISGGYARIPSRRRKRKRQDCRPALRRPRYVGRVPSAEPLQGCLGRPERPPPLAGLLSRRRAAGRRPVGGLRLEVAFRERAFGDKGAAALPAAPRGTELDMASCGVRSPISPEPVCRRDGGAIPRPGDSWTGAPVLPRFPDLRGFAIRRRAPGKRRPPLGLDSFAQRQRRASRRFRGTRPAGPPNLRQENAANIPQPG